MKGSLGKTATLVALCDPEAARDKRRMAYLAWKAEVQEFNEPGGMMDHYASALGGLTHMDFRTGQCEAEPVELNMPGCYILFDSLQDRDCTKVLAKAKFPTLDGIAALSKYGVTDAPPPPPEPPPPPPASLPFTI